MFGSGLASRAWRSQSLRGFSLAEVLIAIVIITILTIGSIAVYSTQIAKARDTERVNDVRSIQSTLDQFIGQYGAPPGPGIAAAVRLKGTKVAENCTDTSNLYKCFAALGTSSEEDIFNMLTDPSQGIPNNQASTVSNYGYLYGADENTYKICAMLEDQNATTLNSSNSGADGVSGTGDDLFCYAFTPPGVASPIATVARLSEITRS